MEAAFPTLLGSAGGDLEVEPAREMEKIACTRVGTQLAERWTLERVLGVGGTAAVFAATHRNGHRVAIKILHRSVAESPTARRRLRREAYVANQLAPYGAVAVVDDGVDGDAPYLVMDLLEGETLALRAERAGGKLASNDALDVVDAVLATLAAAHARGIIHRDVKPQNIFVEQNGRVRVLDFGMAHLECTLSSGDARTASRATLGTPAFMAPEQALGHSRNVGPRTDVWGVGATAFSLLTGRYVHGAATAGEMLIAVGTRPAPSFASVCGDLSPDVTRVLDKALSFDATARWLDAEAMRAALRQARGLPLAIPSTPLPSEAFTETLPEHGAAASGAVPRRASRTTTWGMTAAALVVAAVGVAWASLRHAPREAYEAAGVASDRSAVLAVAPVARAAMDAPANVFDVKRDAVATTSSFPIASPPTIASPKRAPAPPAHMPRPLAPSVPATTTAAASTPSAAALPSSLPATADDLLDRRR